MRFSDVLIASATKLWYSEIVDVYNRMSGDSSIVRRIIVKETMNLCKNSREAYFTK